MEISKEFKTKVVEALIEQRGRFDGSDAAFAKQWGINSAIYSRLKGGEIEKLLQNVQWLTIGRELNVTLQQRKWNMARTEVYNMIEEDIMFCQAYSKSKICVDDCGIGKTYSAKYLSRKLKNCFYLDASQAKTKQLFVRLLAKTIGLDMGKYADMKANIKYYLKTLPNPIVIIDEAGDLEYNAFLELKEFWNATDGVVGWYMIGADGLREKISRGIQSKKVGFRELFSRYSENYTSPVPKGKDDKIDFYKKLIGDVLELNMTNKEHKQDIIRKCLIQENGEIGGLRRAESILLLYNAEAN